MKEIGPDAWRHPTITDEAVRAKTGKIWSEWFTLLDAAGAESMDHRQIVAYLQANSHLSGWWQQSVTVAYEQARGKRVKHETPNGYQISVTKTLQMPIDRLFEAWQDDGSRSRWLPDAPITIRKATPNKSLRITWTEPKTRVNVEFLAKSDSKSQINVHHQRLPSAEDAERMKAYWREALSCLEVTLGTA